MAAQAGASAEERLGLQGQVAPLEEHFIQEYHEETQAEEAAWIALVEALAGLSAFFVSTNGTAGESAPGLRGARTATYTALKKSIRGFHTAFPYEMVKQGVTLAFQKATSACVDTFMADIMEEDPAQRDQLRTGLEACVRVALEKALMAEA